MDLTTILANVGVIIGLFGGLEGIKWFRNRKADARKEMAAAKKEEASAENEKADYAGKIIEQAEERVKQYKDDMERLRKERDEWQAECKGQRKAKQEKRALYEEALVRIHELELENSDLKGKLKEADWHRCEVNGCQKRVPPRTRSSSPQMNTDGVTD